MSERLSQKNFTNMSLNLINTSEVLISEFGQFVAYTVVHAETCIPPVVLTRPGVGRDGDSADGNLGLEENGRAGCYT